MIAETFPVGAFQCNCTILGCEESGEALVIDPGDEVDRILELVKSRGLVVKAVVHTHAHYDHIGGTREIQERTGAECYLHPGDDFLNRDLAIQAQMFGLPQRRPARVDQPLGDEDVIDVGGFSVRVLHTPGHTPGSVTFHMPDDGERLYTGDTLFMGSIGRTDLPGGDYGQLMRSVKDKLLGLPDETEVVPGHGPMTTIGRERMHNPFLQGI